MKVYEVTERNWEGIKTSQSWRILARNPENAVRKAAIMEGYSVSKRYDKVTKLEDGFYILANRGIFLRPVHNYKFSVNEFS